MATPQLSPGVLTREVDLTVGRAENVLDNIGAIAGPFSIGPVDEPIDIATEEDLINVYGKPLGTDAQYEYWMTAASYLTYGGVLKVCRTDGTNLNNANAGVGIASTSAGNLKIKNYDDYQNNWNTSTEFTYGAKNPGAWANGMATAADWMSAASFISMAGIISFMGRDGSVYLMGWTGGYVLLALLLAPYLRKFGKFTVPDFIGDRYYSNIARFVAVVCLIFISFTYIAGQMRGVGIVFSRFLEVDINTGVIIGMAIVFIYAVLGGMKGITYTQVAQYCVLIFAYMVPAIFISILMTGNPIPQLGFGSKLLTEDIYLLDKLNLVFLSKLLSEAYSCSCLKKATLAPGCK